MESRTEMAHSFSFNMLGNRYPSAAEISVLLEAIQRDENRIEAIKEEIQATEEQWRVAHKTFEGTTLVLEDANLRLRAISSLKEVTSAALKPLNEFALDEGDKTRMEDAPATGTSHLAITNRTLKQQDKTKRGLSDRLAALAKAEDAARAAVANEQEAHNVAQVQLCRLDEDIRMYKDQVVALEASIQAKKCLFSSVRKLGPEIWLQIFRFVAFSPPLLSSGVHRKFAAANPAYPLYHVCQSWDAILSNNPSLWSCFYIKSLALRELDVRYLKYCLEHLKNGISLLHLRTLVGLPEDACIVSKIFKTYALNELEIRSSADCTKAVTYLIEHLPTPIALLIHNEDSVERQQKGRFMLQAQPRQLERLRTVTLKDVLLRTHSKQLHYGSMQELNVDVQRLYPITSILGDSYSNVTTLNITGCNFCARKATDVYIFPRLRRITGPIMGLLYTLDPFCQMPALCEIGTWVMESKRPGLSAWKPFLDRDGLRNRLEMIEIHDMDPVDAVFIVKYVRELCSVPRMVLIGRSVDILCQQLVDPNSDGQNLEVQALEVQNYEGDGASILNLVTSYNLGPTSHALRIEEVTWKDCYNVSPRMREDIDQVCQG